MKRSLLLLALLCLAFPVRAEDHDDEGTEEREVEVRVKRGAAGGGPGRGGRGGDEDGPWSRGRGRGMKRIFMSNEHHTQGVPDDPALKEARERLKAANEKVRALRPKLRDAKASDKPALRKETKAAVGELFDAKLAVEQAMLDRMSKQLAQKKDKLAKRKAARETLVEQKTDQLTGDAPSWDD